MALIQIQEPGQSEENQDANEVVIGIDLGTTNSLVAVVEDEKVKFFTDEIGNEIHPSVVGYDGAGNVVGVGEQILKQVQDDGNSQSSPRCHPELVSGSIPTTISSIKRLMGKSFSDVKNEKFAFEIDQCSAKKEVLRIIVGPRKIRPAEVSSEILKYLKNLAETNLKTEVKKAVITVPAYFDEAAKNATKLAANLAGLEVLRLVNEPTAAALAYGLDNSAEGIYCVYDLGGGTFDVSVLKMQKGVFKVLGVAGDNALGGDDFDDLIAEAVGVSRAEARKIKEALSDRNLVTLTPTLSPQGRGSLSEFNFSRADFEKLISPKIEKTFSLAKNLIEDLDLESLDIKGVILVGGSTRIPLVTQKLAEIFGTEKILNKIDPDRIVAAGAAWQAHNLSGHGKNLLLDVTALSLGIEMMGGIVDKVIHRNSTIPTAMAKEFTTYADNQTGMKLHIVQGERELAADCRSLAEFEIKNIPAMKAGLARVAVTFKIDADGLLTVSAEEKITRQHQEIEVRPSYSLDENEIKKMLLDSLKNSQADIAQRLLIQAAVEANHDVDIIRNDLRNFADVIEADETKLISEKLEVLEKLIAEKTSRDAILEGQKELGKAAENLVLRKVNAVLNQKIAGKRIDEV